jgi:hypothetical protein
MELLSKDGTAVRCHRGLLLQNFSSEEDLDGFVERVSGQ